MSNDEQTYLRSRAEAEIAAADAATHPNAAKAHSLMAGYYLDRAHGLGPDDAFAHPVEAEPDDAA